MKLGLGASIDPSIVKLANDMMETEESTDPMRVIELATMQIEEIRLSERRIDPFSILGEDKSYEPDWQVTPASERQLELLAAAGIEKKYRGSKLTESQAKDLLSAIRRRREQGLCTYRQAKLLAKCGCNPHVDFATASQTITKLKSNNWRPLK